MSSRARVHTRNSRDKKAGYFSWIIFSLALTFLLVLSVDLGMPLVGTAVAASLYLAFLCPYSVFSTPWRIGGSYFFGLVYGLAINMSYGSIPTPINRLVAFSLVILFVWSLVRFGMEHPPAASVLISFAIGSVPSLVQLVAFVGMTLAVIFLDYLFERVRLIE